MNRYLIQTAKPEAYDPDDYRHVEQTGMLDGDSVLIFLHTENPLKAGDSLIGGWDLENVLVEPLDEEKYGGIRELGNEGVRLEYGEEGNVIGETRAGVGTGNLKYQDFDIGNRQRELTVEGHLYPNDNAPFFVECRLLYNDIYGWYPRFEVQMEGTDLPNDPSVRNFRIFSSADCIFPGEFLYTLAALQVGDSIWHTDTDGNPLQVWFSESNQFTAGKDAVHFALYWSEFEEGRYTLEAGAEGVRRLLWTRNQGDAEAQNVIKDIWNGNYYLINLNDNTVSLDLQPNKAFDTVLPIGGFLLAEAIELDFRHRVWEVLRDVGRTFVEPKAANNWVETEAVVSGQAGQFYYLSSPTVAGNMVVGETIRLGMEEVVFKGIWPGFTNLIQIDPYVAGLIGEKVYVR